MNTEKKTFTSAKVEVIKFDKNTDVVTTSTAIGSTPSNPMEED